METLKDLANAVIKYWWSFMSSAVFTALGVYVLITSKSSQWVITATFVLAGLFVILAFGLAWKDEHAKLLTEQAKNAAPQLKIDVVELVRTNLLSDKGFTYCARLFVSNTSSARTTVRRVFMRSRGDSKQYMASHLKKVSLTRRAEVPVPPGVEGTMTSPYETLMSDILSNLSTTPVERGVHVDGWLWFKDALFETSAENIEFFAEDSLGHPHGPFSFTGEMEAGYV
jgi:hypothetical protein